jgi:membrane-bound lytic murein transglycosylase D
MTKHLQSGLICLLITIATPAFSYTTVRDTIVEVSNDSIADDVNDSIAIENNDSIPMLVDTVASPDMIDVYFNRNLDSIQRLFYVNDLNHSIKTDSVKSLELSDSDYVARFAKIPSVFKLTYNSKVKNFIDFYAKRRRGSLENMLGLSDYYFPIFEEILDSYDVPLEFKYLPLIESALNPRAVSRAGATGIWQFMFGTGRMYGLNVNSYFDERRDPIKSTHAAARYLRDLYNTYNDWVLALTAYNCGPANVNKAIRRSGGKRNYWEIYYYLPRETRGYVPAFTAVIYIMNHLDDYQLKSQKIGLPIAIDTIMISEDLHLMQVSDLLHIPVQTLRDLNPQYRRDIIPGKSIPSPLTIPAEHVNNFIDKKDSIFAWKDSLYFSDKYSYFEPEKKGSHRGGGYAPSSKNYEKLYYTVKTGDNLGYIASWYNVYISEIKDWNDLSRNFIRKGQDLVIYVPKGKASKYRDINKLSFEEKQKRIGKSSSSNNSGATSTSSSDNSKYVTYTVRSGDTIWDIAKKFPGVSGDDILKLNNITAKKLSPGMVLKIKKKTT